MFFLIIIMLVCINATKLARDFTKYRYAISIPHYLQNTYVPIHLNKPIPKDELIPPYEIPRWVYKSVFKKNKQNKYNS